MSSNKKASVEKPLDAKQDKVQAKYQFTTDELAELGRVASREQNQADQLDRELSSIKKDYQGRIEGAEMRRNNAFNKLTDGFQMREYDAMIVFNTPKKGMKSVYHMDVDAKNKIGELIREEPMSPADCQTELFAQQRADEEKENESKGFNPVLAA